MTRAALWWPERGGTTRSHSEPGSETLQRRWYWDDRSCESRSPPGICPASTAMWVPGSFFVRREVLECRPLEPKRPARPGRRAGPDGARWTRPVKPVVEAVDEARAVAAWHRISG